MRLIGMAAGLAIALAGCAAVPADGPAPAAINNAEEQTPKPPFVVVVIDEKVVNVTGQYRPDAFTSLFKLPDETPSLRLARGDKLTINVYEAGADGLFSSAEAKATQIQAEVGDNGQVFVPYVGPILAEGRTTEALRASIENALVDKAIQPQVQVAVAESIGNSITVVGDVEEPGRQPLPVAGARVLDAIAAAGGSEAAPYELRVVLRRGDRVASADLEDLIDNPEENVPLLPGDVIFVGDETRTFTAFGAVNAPGEYQFEARKVTVAEALARAGGLDDERANPRNVFIFRFEPAFIAKMLNERAVTAPDGTMVPVVYRIDLRNPKSLFFAQLFELRDEDIVYATEAPVSQLVGIFQQVQPLLQFITTSAVVIRTFDD